MIMNGYQQFDRINNDIRIYVSPGLYIPQEWGKPLSEPPYSSQIRFLHRRASKEICAIELTYAKLAADIHQYRADLYLLVDEIRKTNRYAITNNDVLRLRIRETIARRDKHTATLKEKHREELSGVHKCTLEASNKVAECGPGTFDYDNPTVEGCFGRPPDRRDETVTPTRNVINGILMTGLAVVIGMSLSIYCGWVEPSYPLDEPWITAACTVIAFFVAYAMHNGLEIIASIATQEASTSGRRLAAVKWTVILVAVSAVYVATDAVLHANGLFQRAGALEHVSSARTGTSSYNESVHLFSGLAVSLVFILPFAICVVTNAVQRERRKAQQDRLAELKQREYDEMLADDAVVAAIAALNELANAQSAEQQARQELAVESAPFDAEINALSSQIVPIRNALTSIEINHFSQRRKALEQRLEAWTASVDAAVRV